MRPSHYGTRPIQAPGQRPSRSSQKNHAEKKYSTSTVTSIEFQRHFQQFRCSGRYTITSQFTHFIHPHTQQRERERGREGGDPWERESIRKKRLQSISSNPVQSSKGRSKKDQNSKHRSCWRHMLACMRARKKRAPEWEVEAFKKTLPCLLEENPKFPRHKRSKRKINFNKAIIKQKKLDTNAFECYMEYLWRSFSEDKRASFTYLDCLWFTSYLKASSRAKVLTWIKKKHIFSKKYVFVPIVCWSHWSLLIFCHFGESLQSESRRPCMLLLDSLKMANPKRLEPNIRKFVLDIYKAEDRPENKQFISRIPLLVPKVPQQRNNEDCGNFVLYYINLFMEGAPENFSIFEGYPYFMTQNWFSPVGLECFCKKLESFEK